MPRRSGRRAKRWWGNGSDCLEHALSALSGRRVLIGRPASCKGIECRCSIDPPTAFWPPSPAPTRPDSPLKSAIRGSRRSSPDSMETLGIRLGESGALSPFRGPDLRDYAGVDRHIGRGMQTEANRSPQLSEGKGQCSTFASPMRSLGIVTFSLLQADSSKPEVRIGRSRPWAFTKSVGRRVRVCRLCQLRQLARRHEVSDRRARGQATPCRGTFRISW